jgi:phospholipase/lecithinase/hemolysin
MIPLDQVPMYAKNGHPNRYWTAAHNATNWNIVSSILGLPNPILWTDHDSCRMQFMKELVAAGNALTSYMIRDLSTTLPGSTIGYFDSHAFFNDMYTHPTLYLNGTAPANVTGAVRECVLAEGQDTGGLAPCTLATGAARDSFLWADELHPSEQADRQLAQQIWKNLQGKSSKFITMYKN